MKVRYGMLRRWAKYVAHVREGRHVYSVLVWKHEEKDLSADRRTLKWIIKKEDGKAWNELI
jgi:hypothetical protein